jgi:glycosyltransferase involved in cell wall biosynthesis
VKVTLIRSRAIDPAVNKIAKALADKGYEVRLLVWDRQHNLTENSDSGYTVDKFLFKAPYDKFSALFFLPVWWIHELLFLLKHQSDVIHPCDLDTLIPAIMANFSKKARICYTIYDFYANNLPDGKLAPLRNIVRRLVALIEKFGIRYTDVLFLSDESRFEEIKGARLRKLVYIFNSPPDYLNSQNYLIEKDASPLTLFYGGIISKARGCQFMIDAITGLDDVNLVMAGKAHDPDIIHGKNVRYLGWLPSYDDIIQKTLEADVLFRFSDPRIPKTRYESPNKLFEAMMCRKPIIVSDGSSMADIVRKEKCGLVVPYGDPGAIKQAILELKDKTFRSILGENGRKAYERKYSWNIMEERLLSAYQQFSS